MKCKKKKLRHNRGNYGKNDVGLFVHLPFVRLVDWFEKTIMITDYRFESETTHGASPMINGLVQVDNRRQQHLRMNIKYDSVD